MLAAPALGQGQQRGDASMRIEYQFMYDVSAYGTDLVLV